MDRPIRSPSETGCTGLLVGRTYRDSNLRPRPVFVAARTMTANRYTAVRSEPRDAYTGCARTAASDPTQRLVERSGMAELGQSCRSASRFGKWASGRSRQLRLRQPDDPLQTIQRTGPEVRLVGVSRPVSGGRYIIRLGHVGDCNVPSRAVAVPGRHCLQAARVHVDGGTARFVMGLLTVGPRRPPAQAGTHGPVMVPAPGMANQKSPAEVAPTDTPGGT